MTEKRFVLVKCVEHYWGIVDKSLESIDQLVLMHMNKTSVSYIVNVLNQLNDENEQLKDFIRKISTNNEIILANGTIYKIDKVIK